MKFQIFSRCLGIAALLVIAATANAQLAIGYTTSDAGLFFAPSIAGDISEINGGIYSATLIDGVPQILPLGELDYVHGSAVIGSVTFNADRLIKINNIDGIMQQNLTMVSVSMMGGVAMVDGDNAMPALTLDLGSGNLVDIVPVALNTGLVGFGQDIKVNLSVTMTLRQSPSNVPEPGSVALLAGLGIISAGAVLRRRNRK